MNTFTNTIKNNVSTTTTNGMPALTTSSNSVVDLFYNIGGSRGEDKSLEFTRAYNENRDLALRLLQWIRDVRGGCGERDLFRQLLSTLEKINPNDAKLILNKVPEIGRWDDLLSVDITKDYAFKIIADEISRAVCEPGYSSLVGKWMPRKGLIAAQLRKYLKLSAKDYRKLLVSLTNVVEQKMCANQWNDINFNHVPSMASQKYKNVFKKKASDNYTNYLEGLKTGESKVNAAAIYPHEILKDFACGNSLNLTLNVSQWDALPNYMGNKRVLPLIDVSGSMQSTIPGSKVSCMDVAIALGLYVADKSKGAFKDAFLTFHTTPQLLFSKGNIFEKYCTIKNSEWGGTTDFTKTLSLILSHAYKNKVLPDDMPEYLIVFSDMQFNEADDNFTTTKYDKVKKAFYKLGYKAPVIVYWNLDAKYGTTPVSFDSNGNALVSGFSPSLIKPILSCDLESFTPYNIMIKTLMDDRYKY